MNGTSSVSAHRWGIALVVVAALLMGLPTLRGGFVGGDDHRLALDHVFVNHPSWDHAVSLFRIVHRDLYQPLPLLSFQIEFVIADMLGLKNQGPSAFGWLFHLNNVLLHALNSLLVYFLVRSLHGSITGVPPETDIFPRRVRCADLSSPALARSPSPASHRGLVPTAAGLLFAIHPLQTEVVAWLNGRMMLLSTLFLLLGLLGQVRWMDAPAAAGSSRFKRFSQACLVLVCFLCCNLSKVRVETPILMLIVAWATRVSLTRHFAMLWIPCAVLTALFAWVNINATSAADLFTGGEEHLKGPRLVRVALALASYFEHLLWPTGLASHYPTPPIVAWSDPGTVRALIVVGIGASVLVYAALRLRSARLGAIWFVAAIAATLPFVPARNTLAADRYMYVPIIGLLWPIADAISAAYHRIAVRTAPRSIAGTAGFLATSLSVTLIGICWYTGWFYEDPTKKTYRVAMLFPNEPRVWERVGWTQYDDGDYDRAVESAQRELLHPTPAGESSALQLLGMIALRQSRPDDALALLHRALHVDPENDLVHVRLAMAYEELDRLADALPHLEAAVRASPRSNPALHHLATAYRRLGRPGDARHCYEQELNNNAYEWRATVGLVELDLEVATAESRKTAERRLLDLLTWMPDNVIARINLGVVLHALGRTDEAIAVYQVALNLDRRNATAALNLAQLFAAQGDARSAADYFALAAESGVNTFAEVGVLVDYFASAEDHERAARIADDFAARFPRSDDAVALAAWVRLLGGDFSAATRTCTATSDSAVDGTRPDVARSPMYDATCAYLAFLERRFDAAATGVQSLGGSGNASADARRRLLAAIERFDRAKPDEPWTFCLAAELLIANGQRDAARASCDLCAQHCRAADCAAYLERLRSRIYAP